ncbi:MAG: pilus assembly PilX family protein [Pseudomonadota bacterium]
MHSATTPRAIAGVRRERGMALLIALIVLVVVSILGAVAMRTAMFQTRISTNSQTSNLAFQAAESGLSAASDVAFVQQSVDTIRTDPTHIFNKAVNGAAQRVCFTSTSPPAPDDLVEDDGAGGFTYSDPCPVLADSNVRVTTVVDKRPGEGVMPGYDVALTDVMPVRIRSTGEVPNTNVRTVHVQEWVLIVPSGSSAP